MNRTIIWGHRGAGFRDIENSMSSFKKAVDMGVDGVKTEAQLTKDNEIVLKFLPFVVINGKKTLIRDLSLNSIKKVKLENGEPIPTLQEMFKAFNDKIRYNFDIFQPETGENIIEVAQDYNLIEKIELTKPVALTKSPDILFKPLRKKSKDVTLICSFFSDKQISVDDYKLLKDMRKLDVQVINLNHHRFNFEVFKRIKDAGLDFYLWGVLFKYFMRKYLKLTYKDYIIDGIYTNYPDKLVNLRSEILIQ
ncbi:MAG: glycerophosphodiester phosphodiesterase [Promethearchaeota archaeon]|jgi:glycerophosphoryl diester phosphodiesterase